MGAQTELVVAAVMTSDTDWEFLWKDQVYYIVLNHPEIGLAWKRDELEMVRQAAMNASTPSEFAANLIPFLAPPVQE